MARKKQIEVVEQDVSADEKTKLARERRIRKAGLTQDKVEENVREEFRKFFIKIKRSLNLSSDLEEIIWLHFKAYNFDNVNKFEEGVTHFGYKI
jgi:hypothetical protein